MNNKERVFCAVVKTIYDKYLENKTLDYNNVIFTQQELESSFNALHFGKSFKKSLLNNYYYGHGSKKEKVKFIVNAFEEEELGYLRLAFPKENNSYSEQYEITNQGWSALAEYNQEEVRSFLKKYNSWIRKHKPLKNEIRNLSVNEAVWLSVALLTYNAYFHYTDANVSDFFFDNSDISNIAYKINGKFAKSTYSKAVKQRAVKGKGKDEYLSECQKGKRRITFKPEVTKNMPKLDSNIKLYTVNGKKGINSIIKTLQEIALYYLPTNDEYEVLLNIGKADKANICIDHTLVGRDKESVISYVIRTYCLNPTTELEFKNKYFSLLDEVNLGYDFNYIIKDFNIEILDRNDVISCGFNRFRFYSNKGKNAGNIIPWLGLNNLKDQEFSASLIYKNNHEKVQEAKLNNEYELYDYLKKYSSKFYPNIVFLDGLEIKIGKATIIEQLQKIIQKYEPIDKNLLIGLYVQKYGTSKDIIKARLRELSTYYHDGFYRYEKRSEENKSKNQQPIFVKSTLAQIQDGEKCIRRRNPDIELISEYTKKYLNEDSEWGILHNRIIHDFIDVDLVGEIELSDDEYILLMKNYFIPHCKKIISTRNPWISPNILLTVGLVQVAIRKYDNNFWKRISDEIGVAHLTAPQQSKIGGIVSQTLIKYGKAYVDAGEHVRNVLMHAFIVDYYASDFFEYLFQFYNLDLERSISDTCEEEASYICDAIKNPNSKRQQMLSDYSGLSVYASKEYCKNVIAASLIAIDNSFWYYSKDIKGLPSRLYEKFIDWKNNEKGDFRKAKARKDRNSESYRKFFNSPQLVCDLTSDVLFKIILPKQLLQNTENMHRSIYWKVSNGSSVEEFPCTVNEGSFGLKTEEIAFIVDEELIFKAYTFELIEDSIVLRKFTWNSHSICIFDKNGFIVNVDNLSEGEYTGFSLATYNIKSMAIEDSYCIRGLKYYQFLFNTGDILYVPDEANYYVGVVPQRGFSNDGLLSDVFIESGESRLPVYNKIPALVINIEDEKVDGTAIIINNNRIRATNLRAVNIRNAHCSGQKYYYFDLSNITSIKNGINSVDIDIPGSTRGKRLDFFFIKDFMFSFEDSPYINKTRGTLCSNYRIEKKCIQDERTSENEYLDFELADLNNNILKCSLMISGIKHIICFKVPLLLYSTDRTNWTFFTPDDFWYSDLPGMIYLSFPSKSIKLELIEDNGEVNLFTYEKKLDEIIDCDLTKLKSYIGPFHTKKMLNTIKLVDGNNRHDFIRVVNHSVFDNVELNADVNDNHIIGNFDIIGKGAYFASIYLNNQIICEKQPLNQERQLIVEADIISGVYTVYLYEGEVNEDAFDDDIQYHLVGSLKKSLRNPADITGERFELKHLTHINSGKVVRNLSISESMKTYVRLDKKIDNHTYEGTLIVSFHYIDIKYVKKVRVFIPQLIKINSLLVDFYDEYDDIDNLLYDNYAECISTPEYSEQFGKNEKYRRFDPILWTDEEESYLWNVEFVNKNRKIEQAAEEWTKQKHIYKKHSNSIWNK